MPKDVMCPNCGHKIGTYSAYETFEIKVAHWLNAETAYTSMPYFDVWHMNEFPDVTFQVKHANAYHSEERNRLTWTWMQKVIDPIMPHYFILFGIYHSGEEKCFLLSRAEFLSYASKYSGKSYLRVSAKKEADRANRYVPALWKYEVESPEINLRQVVVDRETGKLPEVIHQRFRKASDATEQDIEEMHRMNISGVSQDRIGDAFNFSRSVTNRIICGTRDRYRHLYEEWNKKYNRCQNCGTTELEHKAKGLCRRCYYAIEGK